MSKATFTGGSISLTSRWTTARDKKTGRSIVASGPTSVSGSTSIAYKLPSNAKAITSASVSYSISGADKARKLTVQGVSKVGASSGSFSVSPSGLSGTVYVAASFTTEAATYDEGSYSRTAKITNITLTINYTTNSTTGGGGGGSGGGSGGGGSGGGGQQGTAGYNAAAFSQSGIYAGSDEFPAPPQAIYVFDTALNKTYAFDGVVKMSHDLTLKMEEEPDEKKAANFTNNARNEPNKVSIEVIMSDVYTSRNDLTNRNEVRSKSAMEVLSELKQSRRKVQIITTLLTYNNMLLAGISVTQDESTTHHGWQGQLTFAECYESAAAASGGGGGASTTGSTTKDSGVTNGRTPSVWVSWVGANAIK